MKRICLTIIIVLLTTISFAQSRDKQYSAERDTLSSPELVTKKILENGYGTIGVLDAIETRLSRLENEVNPYYKLYPTQNKWTFLELDTAYGTVYHVQWSLNDNSGRWMLGGITDYDVPDSRRYAGRYELYPTQNIFNFLLVDGLTGKVWQVQWSTERKEEGIWEIK